MIFSAIRNVWIIRNIRFTGFIKDTGLFVIKVDLIITVVRIIIGCNGNKDFYNKYDYILIF